MGGSAAAAADDVSVTLPGRLGDDTMRPWTDPRLDPRLRAHHKEMGTGQAMPAIPLGTDAPYEDRIAFSVQVENEYNVMTQALYENVPSLEEKVSVENVVVTGADGNEIKAVIRKPVNATTASGSGPPLPCIYRIHGGAMAMLSIDDPMYIFLDSTLAEQGAVVVSVEFRNAGGKNGPHPFPAGLRDCVSVLEWICRNRQKLGYSSLIVCGESGGANLSIATALQTKTNENVHVDGIYALCPYISNMYDKSENTTTCLTSLKENDEYTLSAQLMSLISSIYALSPEDQVNPLAWPYHASADDLRGLPPFFISLNELDPLRDEGKALYLKLIEAGVPATCHIVCGTEHGADLVLARIIPDVFDSTIRSIVTFARSFSEE